MNKHLILVGPMGAGKSTIGLLLSKQLKIPLIDIDRAVEQRAGANIAWIFEKEGEDGFRKREQQVLSEVCTEPAAVIATGGGIVISKENRCLLKQAGVVIYLNVSLEQQLLRTVKDKSRPLLQVGDSREVLKRLTQEREPFYREISTIVINTDKRSPRLVVKEIMDKIKGVAEFSQAAG